MTGYTIISLGKAVVNGFEMAALLLSRPVEVPEQLMRHYLVLAQVSAENRPGAATAKA
jgi:hypothetical protein